MTAPVMAQPADPTLLIAARRATAPFGMLARISSDLTLIFLGFWLAYLLRYELEIGGTLSLEDSRPFLGFLPVLVFLMAVLLTIFGLRGVYRLPRWTGFLDKALLISSSVTIGFSILIVTVFYTRLFFFSRLILLYALLLITLLLVTKRLLWHYYQGWMRAHGHWIDRVLVVGAGPAGEQVMGALMGHPELGCKVVGFVEDEPRAASWGIATQRAVVRPTYLGACAELSRIIQQENIDEVIVALPPTAHSQLYQVIEQCREERVPFMLTPDLFELSLTRVEIYNLQGRPLITMKDTGIRGWNFVLKRAFDLVCSVTALTVAGVPMLIVALLIRLDSRGPIFYRQQRVGRNGRIFTCYKFRSMYQDADQQKALLVASAQYSGDRVMFKMKDDPRRTRVGRWLRRTSFDELPNLFNVLRGEMSIVGPRPHLPQEVAQYEPWQRQRLATTPGITCLWQVNGRSHLTFREQALLDLYYAEHWSLWLDFKIILKTIPAVMTARGAY